MATNQHVERTTPGSHHARSSQPGQRDRIPVLAGVGGLAAVVLIATIVAAGAHLYGGGGRVGAIRIGDNGLFVPFPTGDADSELSRLPDDFEWLTVRGTWGVLSNTAYVSRTEGESSETLAMISAPENVNVSARLSTVADNAGLVFGYTDEQNYWAAAVRTRDNFVELRRVGGDGNPIVAASPRGLSLPDGLRLRVRHDETGISVTINGEVVINFPDAPTVPDSYAGMLASGAAATEARFDDLTVMDAAHVPETATTQSAP